jgi:hypothetical protein
VCAFKPPEEAYASSYIIFSVFYCFVSIGKRYKTSFDVEVYWLFVDRLRVREERFGC